MRIGDLSGHTGVATHQLRAWERRYGLLKPRRSAGNYRLYSPADAARVRLMQR
jgi:DNA-binding transcriptional MerR regulator